jgi:hypothetical protein|tara:strand:- start:62 stop:337 length:276 start_codon:yes stop_codon:yes gene_type:complete
MLFRKKKIKETPKARLYGNRYNNQNFSVWDSMSFIEQIAMIFLPCMLGFIFYMILDITELIWWLRVIISVGMVGGCIGLITLIVNFFSERY